MSYEESLRYFVEKKMENVKKHFAPAQPVAMTDEWIDTLHDSMFPRPFLESDRVKVRAFVRAALAAQVAPKVPEVTNKHTILAKAIADNIVAHSKAGREMTGWLDDACAWAGTLAKELAAPSPEAKAQAVPEDTRRAVVIASAAQQFAKDRTHLGNLVYVNDLVWALKVLAAPQPPIEAQAVPVADALREIGEWDHRGDSVAEAYDEKHGFGAFMKLIEDATFAAPQPPAPSEPFHIGACITDGRLHVTVMRREGGVIHVLATAEMDAESLKTHDGYAVTAPAPSEQRKPLTDGEREDAARFRWVTDPSNWNETEDTPSICTSEDVHWGDNARQLIDRHRGIRSTGGDHDA